MENQNTPKSTREVSEATKTFFNMQATYYLNYFKTTLLDGDDPLHFLLRRLEGQRSTLAHLQIPWEKSVSFVHRGSVLAYERNTGDNSRKKTLNLSSAIIDAMMFLVQDSKSIHAQISCLNEQIEDLKALIGEEKTEDTDTPTE